MAVVKAKFKFDRTIGGNLFNSRKSPIFKRNYKPGQHGQSKRRKKVSDFGEKINEVKKVKLFYGGLRRKDIKRIVHEGIRKKGNSNDNIVQILESRLATVVYRAKFAVSPFAARQLVNHGNVLVNGKTVDIWSYRLKENDIVSLKKHMIDNPHVVAAMKSTERDIPSYIVVKGNEISYAGANIQTAQYNVSMNFTSLIEFFTR